MTRRGKQIEIDDWTWIGTSFDVAYNLLDANIEIMTTTFMPWLLMGFESYIVTFASKKPSVDEVCQCFEVVTNINIYNYVNINKYK